MNSLFVRCVIGGAAALLAWLLMEPTAPTVITDMKLWESFELRLTLSLGVLLGSAVGGYQGFLQGGKIHTLRGVLLGAFLGAAGISLGQRIGGGIFEALTQGKGTAIIVILIPARFLALTFVGAGR